MKSNKRKAAKPRVKSHKRRAAGGNRLDGMSERDYTGAQATELALNQALGQYDYKRACQLADTYLEKYKDRLTYKHLVILAEVYLQENLYEKCHGLLQDALRLDADSELAPEILFWMFHKKGDTDNAESVLRKLVAEGPEHKQEQYAEWRALRGNAEADHKKVLEAIEAAGGPPKKDNPRYHELMFSYLMALCGDGRAEEASAVLEQIPEELQRESVNLPMIKGQIYRSMDRLHEAEAAYTDILNTFGEVPEARWNRTLIRLQRGDLNAWDDYLRRWEWSGFPSPKIKLDAPRWVDEDLAGKTVLLWPEQGLGDQVLFLTLAIEWISNPEINVMVVVHPKLVGLVSAWYPEANVVPMPSIDLTGLPEFESVDYQMPYGDLARVFLDSPDKLRSRRQRFMRSDPTVRAQIIESMGWGADDVLVGVCWRSSHIQVSRVAGYLGVNMVQTLQNNVPSNVRFVCLQYRLTDEERQNMHDWGVYVSDVEFFDDVLEHGKHVGACDYVITAGTLTKQLAGLFDRDTITWSEDSWSMLGQEEYPWYRSVATLKTQHDHSLSSLVYLLGKWLNFAIEHTHIGSKAG